MKSYLLAKVVIKGQCHVFVRMSFVPAIVDMGLR